MNIFRLYELTIYVPPVSIKVISACQLNCTWSIVVAEPYVKVVIFAGTLCIIAPYTFSYE